MNQAISFNTKEFNTTVYARTNENIFVLLSRFRFFCIRNGVMQEMKKRESYQSPSMIKHQNKCRIKHERKLLKLQEQRELLMKQQGRKE